MGKVTVVGGKVGMEAPSGGILASDLAVGSTVKLMENGSPVEYLVVNQGKPSGSSLYDASCDGTWLLRKDIYENRAWHSSDSNNYGASTIHSYLNNTFLGLFEEAEQTAIKQVKIPYVNGTGSGGTVASGANGLSAKVFLLGGYELGWTQSTNQYFPIDGASLSYFNNATDSKRVAYLNGTASYWWLRSPYTGNNISPWGVKPGGGWDAGVYPTTQFSIRPALVLSKTAIFDTETMLLRRDA